LLSHPIFHKKNLEFVINIPLDNDFPLNTIFNKIYTRLKKLFNFKLNSYTNIQKPSNDKSVEHAEKKYVFRI